MTGFRFLRGSSLILGLVVGSCTHDSTAPNRPPQIAIGPATGHWTADGPDFIAAMDVSDTVILTTGLGTVRGNGSFTGPGIAGAEGRSPSVERIHPGQSDWPSPPPDARPPTSRVRW